MSDDRGVVFGDAAGGVLAAFLRVFGAGGDWNSPRSFCFAGGRSAFFFEDFGAAFRVAGAGGDWKAPRLAGGASICASALRRACDVRRSSEKVFFHLRWAGRVARWVRWR